VDPFREQPCTCDCGCPSCRPAPVLSPIAELAVAARELARRTPSEVSERQALAEAEALNDVMQQLRVQQLARLADVSERKLHELSGYRSTRSWLRETAPDADATDLSLSGVLETYPWLSAAVASGEVSMRAAKRVTTALSRLRGHVDQEDGLIDGQPAADVIGAVVMNVVDVVSTARRGLADDDEYLDGLIVRVHRIARASVPELTALEQAFTVLAGEVPLGCLAQCLDKLVVATVPSLLEKRAAEAAARAALSLERQPDGSSWTVRGQLDAECGERLFTALSAEAHRDPSRALDTEAWAAVRDEAPAGPVSLEDVSSAGRPRDRGRRLHDALNRLLGRYLEQGLAGSHQKMPLQMNVTLPSALLDRVPGALPAVGDSGAPLARSMVRRWWCDSRVTAYLVGRGFTVLGHAHAGRTLTAAERRAALISHDNRCAGAGCCPGRPDPLTPLRPHHVFRFARDGVTRLADTVMICDSLHHDLHTGGRTVRLRDGRLLREDGWVDDP
ncbi:MAG: uncharacterized protein JWO12_1197, partial [Frankiales bacterium]|nr:uncharacterized protein [Frankiales bacterium]